MDFCNTYGCKETKNLKYIYQDHYCPDHYKQIAELGSMLHDFQPSYVLPVKNDSPSQNTIDFDDDAIPKFKTKYDRSIYELQQGRKILIIDASQTIFEYEHNVVVANEWIYKFSGPIRNFYKQLISSPTEISTVGITIKDNKTIVEIERHSMTFSSSHAYELVKFFLSNDAYFHVNGSTENWGDEYK